MRKNHCPLRDDQIVILLNEIDSELNISLESNALACYLKITILWVIKIKPFRAKKCFNFLNFIPEKIVESTATVIANSNVIINVLGRSNLYIGIFDWIPVKDMGSGVLIGFPASFHLQVNSIQTLVLIAKMVSKY